MKPHKRLRDNIHSLTMDVIIVIFQNFSSQHVCSVFLTDSIFPDPKLISH